MSRVALFLAGLLLSAGVIAQPAPRIPAVEYYHAGLDHYFLTANLQEIALLDAGRMAGWARTGQQLAIWAAGANEVGIVPVCRFYGRPEAGLDSHFYAADAAECQAIQQQWAHAWQLESSDVFGVRAAVAGSCPAGTVGVHRLYNNRPDVNHRYTRDSLVFADMLARQYVPEGTGTPPVVFCAPEAPDTAVPTCALAARDDTPTTGTTLVLQAACTGQPTSYEWSGCSGSVASCSTSQAVAGTQTYAVRGRNELGTGAWTSLAVAWQGPTTAPECTVTGNQRKSWVGTTIVLTATCSNQPTHFAWTHCSGTGNWCTATSANAGEVTYAVRASNAAGTGSSVDFVVNWLVPGPGAPVCTVVPSAFTPVVGDTLTLQATCANSAARYEWSNCIGSGASCTTTWSAAENRKYAVVGHNTSGSSAPAVVSIDWQAAPPPPPPAPPVPVCSVSAQPTTASVGATVVLTATCSNSPTTYVWTNCSSTTAMCTASAAQAGSQAYRVTASNAGGSSTPAEVSVIWSAPAVACTLAANTLQPVVGTSLTLTATCTGNPTIYSWTDCSSLTATCAATAAAPGPHSYAVAASGPAGASAPAWLTVTWQPAPTQIPVCTIAPAQGTPAVGTSLTLTASCSNSPTSFAWTNCNSTSATCTVSSNTPGSLVYGVQASNAAGTSAQALAVLDWQGGSTPGAPVCTLTAAPSTTPRVGTDLTLTATCSNNPYGYAWVGCNSTSNVCVAQQLQPGFTRYSLLAANGSGLSSEVGIDVTWQP